MSDDPWDYGFPPPADPDPYDEQGGEGDAAIAKKKGVIPATKSLLLMVWRLEVAVVRGIRMEFSHVVYFICIERALHYFVHYIDWHKIASATVEAVVILIPGLFMNR